MFVYESSGWHYLIVLSTAATSGSQGIPIHRHFEARGYLKGYMSRGVISMSQCIAQSYVVIGGECGECGEC